MFSLNPDKKQSILRYRNTHVVKDSYACHVTLHDTTVCSVYWWAPALGIDPHARNAYVVKLNSGGWRTVTTKKRMNEVAHELGLDFRVFQRDGEWILEFGDGTQTVFKDNTTFACGMQLNN